jgi:RNA polymerase sigma-70 factor (ECF subfamily)
MSGTLPQIEALIPALRRYAWALLRSSQDADDLVHDCLVRALDRLHTLRDTEDLRPWLFSIMHNQFISQSRRLRRKRHGEHPAQIGQDIVVQADQEDRLRWRDMLSGLDSLPEDQRSVLLLVSVEGLSYAETAQVVGVPIGTVMSRLARGRERLRQVMQGDVQPCLRTVK